MAYHIYNGLICLACLNLSESGLTGPNMNSYFPYIFSRALAWPHMAYVGLTCPNMT
jgi:hypothetical protein